MLPILQAEVGTIAGDSEPATISGEDTPWGLSPQQVRTAYAFPGITSGDGAGRRPSPSSTPTTTRTSWTARTPISPQATWPEFDQQYGLPDPPSFVKINEQGSSPNLPGTDPREPGRPATGRKRRPWTWSGPTPWPRGPHHPGRVQLEQQRGPLPGRDDRGLAAGRVGRLDELGLRRIQRRDLLRRRLHHAGRSSGRDLRGRHGRRRIARHVSGLFAERRRRRRDEPDAPRRRCLRRRDGLVRRRRRHQHHRARARLSGRRAEHGMRTIPDVSFDADPNTGVSVYDSYNDTSGQGPGRRSAARAWRRPAGPP